MAFSFSRTVADGTTTEFVIPFPFIERDHVTVKVDNVETSFTWIDDGRVTVSPAPSNGAVVERRRNTPIDEPLVDYTDGSVLPEADLDLTSTQLLYVTQEAFDTVDEALNQNASGAYDAGGRRIVNIADAVADTDVPSFGQINTSVATATTKASEAAASAASALTHKTAAQAAQALAEAAQALAEAAEDGSVAAQAAAEAAQGLAEKWATEDEDVAVTTGKYSALHHATKAAAYAAAAAASEAAAASSASAASDDSVATAADRAAVATDRAAVEAALSDVEDARDAALLALDQFTDVYLGSYTTDPTLNNDGDPLAAGNLYFNSVTESLRVYGASGWQEYASTSGRLAQELTSVVTASSSTTSNIPADNTIPQSSEGAEVTTKTITPTNAASTIRVEAVVFCSISSYTNATAAVFKDSETDAFAAGVRTSNTGDIIPIHVSGEFTAGTTSPITIKLRAGSQSGTLYINRFTTGDLLGGTLKSVLTVKEILP